jgi:anti-sigma factor RsiW
MEDHREDSGVCRCPPSPGDIDLIAAVDGEAGEEVVAHLRDCPHCAQRVRDFDELQRLLRQRLYRILCPSSDDLLAYRQGWLDDRRASAISAHLRDCPHCVGEVRLLDEAAGVPPWPPPISQLRRVVAAALAPRPQPVAVYGGMRSSGHSMQYAYRAERLELMLDVQRATGRPGRVVLVGTLLDEEALPGETQRAIASLLEGDFVVSSAALDELGNFVLDDITPGDYSLSLRLPDLEVVVEVLTL